MMTEAIQLEHTRGVPLRSLAILCTLIKERGGGAEKRSLMMLGKKNELRGFAQVERGGPLPTRVRHHEYALYALELVSSADDYYVLTPKGQSLAEISISNNLRLNMADAEELDTDLPSEIQLEFSKILCASRYVRHWWLKFLMPRDRFSYQDLLSEGKDFVIERVPVERRELARTAEGREARDTGLRIHSYFAQYDSLPLTSVERREIYTGIRKWTIDIELVSQIGGWDRIFDIEEEYSRRLESQHSKLERVYVVRKKWNNSTPIDRFEELLVGVKEKTGYTSRIPIPELVITLALEENFSIVNIHALLQRLHKERHGRYFFESASKSVITQQSNPFPISAYVQIEGTWRTDIIFNRSTS